MTTQQKKTFSILVTGIGGLGVMWMSKVIACAANSSHRYVCRTETRGLSQRGGAVCSEVRFGCTPLTPVTACGNEDMILSLDALEAVRVLHCLRTDGTLLTNEDFSTPAHLTSKWSAEGQEHEHATRLKNRIGNVLNASPQTIVCFDLRSLARNAGSEKMLNTVLMGAASLFIPVDSDELFRVVSAHVKPEQQAMNERAFMLGREAASCHTEMPRTEILRSA